MYLYGFSSVFQGGKSFPFPSERSLERVGTPCPSHILWKECWVAVHLQVVDAPSRPITSIENSLSLCCVVGGPCFQSRYVSTSVGICAAHAASRLESISAHVRWSCLWHLKYIMSSWYYTWNKYESDRRLQRWQYSLTAAYSPPS